MFADLRGFEIPDFTAVRDPYVLANTTFMHTAYTKTVAYLPDAGDGVGGPVWVDHAQGERRLARQQLLSADLDRQSARDKTATGGSAHRWRIGGSVVARFSHLATHYVLDQGTRATFATATTATPIW